MLDSHRVMPHSDGWQVKRDGGQKASHVVDTKKEAIEIARKISTNQSTELQIHNKDGKIGSRDSHGRDPYPPKG